MFIQELRLQNYRCFSDTTFTFNKQLVLIEGENGSGKTTILEALYYSCFLKSFRTNRVKDLLSFEKSHFFLSVSLKDDDGATNVVQVGLSIEEQAPKKLIQFNKTVIKSYRDLISHYRVISLSEEDLFLVQGAPEIRRYFLNQLLVLFKPDYFGHLKKYRQILDQRNSLFMQTTYRNANSAKNLEIWTKQLWEESIMIQKERIIHLETLEGIVNELLSKHFSSLDLSIAFKYHIKNNINEQNFDVFWEKYQEKQLESEWKFRRSLFGAHLDDFTIIFKDKKARQYASRGQQKLVIFLIKIALVQKLTSMKIPVALLLDDFLTDFDQHKLRDCLLLLSTLSSQVFITCPLKSFILNHYQVNTDNIQIISL